MKILSIIVILLSVTALFGKTKKRDILTTIKTAMNLYLQGQGVAVANKASNTWHSLKSQNILDCPHIRDELINEAFLNSVNPGINKNCNIDCSVLTSGKVDKDWFKKVIQSASLKENKGKELLMVLQLFGEKMALKGCERRKHKKQRRHRRH